MSQKVNLVLLFRPAWISSWWGILGNSIHIGEGPDSVHIVNALTLSWLFLMHWPGIGPDVKSEHIWVRPRFRPLCLTCKIEKYFILLQCSTFLGKSYRYFAATSSWSRPPHGLAHCKEAIFIYNFEESSVMVPTTPWSPPVTVHSTVASAGSNQFQPTLTHCQRVRGQFEGFHQF